MDGMNLSCFWCLVGTLGLGQGRDLEHSTGNAQAKVSQGLTKGLMKHLLRYLERAGKAGLG